MKTSIVKTNRLATLGIIFALIGICCAIFQDDLRAFAAPDAAKNEQSVLAKGIQIFTNDNVSQNKHDLVAFTLGVLAYIRHADRASGVAAALGVIAFAWQYVLIGLVIAVVLVFISGLA